MARIALAILLQLVFISCYSQTGALLVVVKGIQSQKGGALSTGLFVGENFPKVGKQLFGNESIVTATEIKITFDKVTPGTYGVVSFQDIDKNKQLKTNFVGYPTEPIGFSRDAKIKFGPPDFDDAKIRIEADKTLTIVITLK